MSKKRKVKIGNIIAYVVIVLVIVAVVGSVAFLTNGFSSDFKTFFLRVNGRYVAGDVGDFVVSQSSPLEVETIYLLNSSDEEQNIGYQVEIKPNEGISFQFAVDDVVYNSKDVDWAKGFDIIETDKGFKLIPKADNLSGIISLVCGGEIIDYSVPAETLNMFCLSVYSSDKSVCINVYFSVVTEVYSVSFDTTGVVL